MPDGLSARVAGPSTIFPRGFLWQLPFWYAAVLAILAFSRWPPLWFRAGAAAGLLGAMLTLIAVLSALKRAAEAATMLLVEQNLQVARTLAEKVVVLDQGGVVYTGDVAELLADPALAQRYLGVGAH